MTGFAWDPVKEVGNIIKHHVDFSTASFVFKDPHRLMYVDAGHSGEEERFFCVGKVDNRILTVRYMVREEKIRIIGAGYWRKGKRDYEK